MRITDSSFLDCGQHAHVNGRNGYKVLKKTVGYVEYVLCTFNPTFTRGKQVN